MTKRLVVGFVFFIMYLLTAGSAVNAEDLTLTYSIASPEYVEVITYTCTETPFTIKAPKGWYMAMVNDNVTMESFRAVFSEKDPTESMRKGFFRAPYIRIDIARALDFENTSIIDYCKRIIPRLKDQDIAILEEVKTIEAGGILGGHFTTSGFDDAEAVIDNYYFIKNKRIIMIAAFCNNESELKRIEAQVKEAISSINFTGKQEET